MEGTSRRLLEVGEKAIIRDIITPLLNPERDPDSVGDDCAIVPCSPGDSICISTDRVPANLVSFKLGILDYRGLGNYLAVLNLSDIAAMGGAPLGLLLNLGLPDDLRIADLTALLEGAKDACATVGCKILGGDLSSATELSISATSFGSVRSARALRRRGAQPDDAAYCTSNVGIAPTAFSYFLKAAPAGMRLPEKDEEWLKDCFRKPRPRFDLGSAIVHSGARATAMDNTDGVAQSYSEIAAASDCGIALSADSIPIHELTHAVAEFLKMDPTELALGPGADFQLLGTIEPAALDNPSLRNVIYPVGTVIRDPGIFLDRPGQRRMLFAVRGWDYYAGVERAHVGANQDPLG